MTAQSKKVHWHLPGHPHSLLQTRRTADTGHLLEVAQTLQITSWDHRPEAFADVQVTAHQLKVAVDVQPLSPLRGSHSAHNYPMACWIGRLRGPRAHRRRPDVVEWGPTFEKEPQGGAPLDKGHRQAARSVEAGARRHLKNGLIRLCNPPVPSPVRHRSG